MRMITTKHTTTIFRTTANARKQNKQPVYYPISINSPQAPLFDIPDMLTPPRINLSQSPTSNLLLSLMSPPVMRGQHSQTSFQHQNFTQQTNAFAVSKNYAPNINVYGGTVNINYSFGNHM